MEKEAGLFLLPGVVFEWVVSRFGGEGLEQRGRLKKEAGLFVLGLGSNTFPFKPSFNPCWKQ